MKFIVIELGIIPLDFILSF